MDLNHLETIPSLPWSVEILFSIKCDLGPNKLSSLTPIISEVCLWNRYLGPDVGKSIRNLLHTLLSAPGQLLLCLCGPIIVGSSILDLTILDYNSSQEKVFDLKQKCFAS